MRPLAGVLLVTFVAVVVATIGCARAPHDSESPQASATDNSRTEKRSRRVEDVIAPIKNISRDQFLERVKSLEATHITAWQTALQDATGESLTRFQVFDMLPHFHPCWKADVFQNDASEKYLKRVRSVPPDTIGAWREVLGRKYPDPEDDQPLSNTLLRIVVVDELFEEDAFQSARSADLLAHLAE